jgi:hypothetical protein
VRRRLALPRAARAAPARDSAGARYLVSLPRSGVGIGSRLMHLAEALWIARKLGRTLLVDWRKTVFFTDSSRNYFTELFEPAPELAGVPIAYAPLQDEAAYKHAVADAPLFELRAYATFDDATYVVARSSVLDPDRLPGHDEAEFGSFREAVYRQLTPRSEVRGEVERFCDAHFHDCFVVGVNVSTGNGAFAEGEAYAGRTDVSVFGDEKQFVRTIRNACKEAVRALPSYMRATAKVFVATDSAPMSALLSRVPRAVTRRTVFPPPGAGRHFSAYHELGYDEWQAQADILIDMLLLGRCNALVHHRRSKFGIYALVTTRYFNGNVHALEDLV